MTDYVFIENNQIIYGPGPIPKAWRNVSRPDLHEDPASLGWIEVVQEAEPEFDSDTHFLEGAVALVDGVPVRSWTIVPKSGNVNGQVSSVTPLQMRKALRAAGLKALVDAHIETLTAEEREEWEYCISVDRDHPTIAAAAAALGKSTEEIDQLFALAASL